MKRGRGFRPGAPAIVFFGLLLSFAAAAQTRFTDDGGRAFNLPAHVEHVLPAGPPASVDLLMISPEKLLGVTSALTPDQKAYLPPVSSRLPAVGRLTGRGNTVNLEKFLSSSPDLAVDVGYVGGVYLSLADRVQSQTGVPYALIGGSLAETPTTLRRLGALVGEQTRAEALAHYAEDTLNLLKDRIANIPADKRPRVYIARGPRGLETGVAGSINSEALELAGAVNVAPPTLGSHGIADVSLEQLLTWRPDVIIALDPSFYKSVSNDPAWGQLPAVRDKKVFLAPSQPFGWVDEPPAANRLIGLRWLAQILYPSLFPEDIRAETKQFYALFYQKAPTDKQLDELFAGSAGP